MKTQGTISITIGSHNIIHSYFVWRAFRVVHGRRPDFTETVCILLHDIGHLGTNYLDNLQEKKDHWKLGAQIARLFFGARGYNLIAGHCDYSEEPRSLLYKADKYSWHITPFWWIYFNNIVEPKIKCGMESMTAVRDFKARIAQMVESGEYYSAHQMFIDRQKKYSKNT